jgi:hypothetical protein
MPSTPDFELDKIDRVTRNHGASPTRLRFFLLLLFYCLLPPAGRLEDF